jgi:hypothetical protein
MTRGLSFAGSTGSISFFVYPSKHGTRVSFVMPSNLHKRRQWVTRYIHKLQQYYLTRVSVGGKAFWGHGCWYASKRISWATVTTRIPRISQLNVLVDNHGTLQAQARAQPKAQIKYGALNKDGQIQPATNSHAAQWKLSETLCA